MSFHKKPKYAIRKLTVGVCSVMLGMIVAATNASAQEIDSALTTPKVEEKTVSGNTENPVSDSKETITELVANEVTAALVAKEEERTAARNIAYDVNPVEAPKTAAMPRDKRTEQDLPTDLAFRATPTIALAQEGPTNYNKSGLQNNPVDGSFSSKEKVFGEQDFSNATAKSYTLDKQKTYHRDHVGDTTPESEVGAVTYNWKEKRVSATEAEAGALDGWKIEGTNNYVTLVKPEEPTNVAPRPAEFAPKPSKIYTNNGQIVPNYTQLADASKPSGIGTILGATVKLGTLVNGAGKTVANPMGYYMELGTIGTKIYKDFDVNPGSQLYFQAITGGAYGTNTVPSTGERVKFTLTDAQTGAVIQTIKDTIDGKEDSVTKNPSPGSNETGWSDLEGRIYNVPSATKKVRVTIEALDNGSQTNVTNIQDGFLVGGVSLKVGPGLEITTDVKKGSSTGEYGPENPYKKSDRGEFIVTTKNVGGLNPYVNGKIGMTIKIPEGIELTDEVKNSKGVWLGDTFASEVKYDASTRTLTYRFGHINGDQVIIGPNGQGSRTARIPFLVTDGFKGAATIKVTGDYHPADHDGNGDKYGNSLFNANQFGRYRDLKTGGNEFSDNPSYWYSKTLYVDAIVPKAPSIEVIHTDAIAKESTALNQPRQIKITLSDDDKMTDALKERLAAEQAKVDVAIAEAEAAKVVANNAASDFEKQEKQAEANELEHKAQEAQKGYEALQKDIVKMVVNLATEGGGKHTITLTKENGVWKNGSERLFTDGKTLILDIPTSVNLVEGVGNNSIVATDSAGNNSQPATADTLNAAPAVGVGNPSTKFYKKSNAVSDEELKGYGKLTVTDLEDDRDGMEATKPTTTIVNKGGFDATVPGTYTITVKSTDSEGKDSSTATYEVEVLDLITVNPDNPKIPETPVDPTDPKKGVYPPGVAKDDLNKEVKRTVHFKDDKGNTVFQDNENTVKYTRVATVNPDTKEVTYTDWTAKDGNHTFDAVPAPVKDGYYTDKANVPAKELSTENAVVPTLTNEEETITYKPLGSWVAKVPQEDGSTTDNTTKYPNDSTDPTATGTPTNTIPYVEGYTPTVNGTPLTPKDPANPSAGYNPPAVPADKGTDTVIDYAKDPQVATVNFKDDKGAKVAEPITLNGNSGETIPKETVDNHIQTLKDKGYTVVTNGFDPDGTAPTFDKDKNVPQSFDVVVKPVIVEVTPDKPATPGTPIDPNNPTGPQYPAGVEESNLNKSVTRTVTYTNADGTPAPAPVAETVKFTRTATVNAVTKEVTYGPWTAENGDSTFEEVPTPVQTGYVADKATVPTKTIATTNEAVEAAQDETVPVTYKKLGSWVVTPPTGNPTETVYPNDPKDPTKPGTPTQTVPYEPGYTPVDGNGNPLTPVNPTDPSQGYKVPEVPQDPTQNTNITYVKADQKATVNFVNQSNNNALLDTVSLTGKSEEAIPTTDITAKLDALKAKGYEVVTNPFDNAQNFDNNQAVDQTFEVVLREKTTTVDPNDPNAQYPEGVTENDLKKDITRTVTYVDNKGNSVNVGIVDKVTFTRTATVNAVTGKVTFGEWTAKDNDTTFDEVKSPVVQGYVANKASIPATTGITPTSKDENHVVIYTPLGKVVITNPDGSTEEVPYTNNPNDPTKPNDTNVVPYKPGQTPKDKEGNPLEPVNPNKPEEGYKVPTPTDPSKDTPVHYDVDSQKAIVKFVNEKDKAEIAKVELDGQSGTAIPTATVEAKLTELKAKGYEVVTDEFANATDKKFDSDSQTDQTYVVTLREKTVEVTPENPKNPGDKVNPNDPTSPTYPDGVKQSDLNKQVVRNVEYVNADGTVAPFPHHSEALNFKRSATVNLVTGAVTYGDWTSTDNTFDAVPTPVQTGYVADIKEVPAETIATDDASVKAATDKTVKVTYKKLGSWVVGIPTEDGTETTKTTYPNDPQDPTKAGTPDKETIPYVPGYTPKVGDTPLTPKDPQDPTKGYIPPTPTNPSEDTLIHYSIDNQAAVVHFVDKEGKKLSDVELTGKSGANIDPTTVNAKIKELEKAGYEVVSNDFNGNGNVPVYDKDAAKKQEFTVTVTPKVVTVDPNDPNVKYPEGVTENDLKKDITRTVKFVDKDGNEKAATVKDKVTFTRTAEINLVTKAITYGPWTAKDGDTTFDEVKSPVVEGYLANKASIPATTGLTETSPNENEEVVYTPLGKVIVTTPDGKTTEITYPNDPKDPTKPGKPGVVPFIPGHMSKDKDGNPLKPVDPKDPTKGYEVPTPKDPTKDTPVHYDNDAQKAVVKFINAKDKAVLGTVEIEGKSGEVIDPTNANAKLVELQNKGYEVLFNGFEGKQTFDNNDATTQEFTVIMQERVVDVDKPVQPGTPVDPNNPTGPKYPAGLTENDLTKVVTRTVKYVDKEGNEVAKTVTDKVSFTRTAKVNLVTGEVTYGDWKAVDGDTSFDEVKVPVVEGYLADKAVIPATNGLTAESKDENHVVTYTKLGKVVITTPDGKTTETTYPNDPKDPTKPGKPGVVPFIPGHMPKDKDGNPLKPVDPQDPTKGYEVPTPQDPTKDTPISYGKVEVPTTTPIVVLVGTPITPKDVENHVKVPDGGKIVEIGEIPSTETPGDKPGVTVVVELPNGERVTVEVPVKVTPKEDPNVPIKPVEPTKPVRPEQPTEPTKPETPAKPNKPAMPAKPVYVDPSQGQLPDTGEETNTLFFGAAAMSILASLGMVAVRKKDEAAE